MNEIKNERSIPGWLKELQENSWELELLISGGAIFSLFQLSAFFIGWVEQLSMTTAFPGMSIFLIVGLLAIKILTLGFSIHLILRAYWLSMVCVNHVFSDGIIKKKIVRQKPFVVKVQDNANLKDQILKTDRNCGIIMYLSITSATIAFGFTLVFFSLLLILNFVEYLSLVVSDYVFTTLMSIFLLYIIDLCLFGVLRKVPYFSYFLFPFFKIYDYISLRGAYQNSLWLFNSNIKKGKFLLGAIIFGIIAVILSYFSVYKYMNWANLFDQRLYRAQIAESTYLVEGSYMENWDQNTVKKFGISQKIITGNFIEVFIRYNQSFDQIIVLSNTNEAKRSFDKIFEIKINGTIYPDLDWLTTEKLNNSITGISAMIPLDSLKNGRHELEISFSQKIIEKLGDKEYQRFQAFVPFWIDRK